MQDATPAPDPARNPAGNSDLVYRALASVLSGQLQSISWSAFTETDWSLFEQVAHPHQEGVGPLVYWAFRDGSWPGEMPAHVRTSLQTSYYNTLAHNTLLFRELGKILIDFHTDGIPVVVLKGAALAVTAYEDSGLRPMGDLDLLVAPSAVRQAWKILERMGYQVLSANTEVVLRKFGAQEIGVDLHWCLVSGYENRAAEIDWLSQKSLEFHLPGADIAARTFAPEIHLPYLAAHTYNQRLLRAYYDLNLLIASPSIDWSRVHALLETTGWGAIARRMLARSAELFDQPLPVEAGNAAGIESKPLSPPQASRTQILLSSWKQLDPVTIVSILFRVVFPTRNYLEWRYRRSIAASLPFWVLVRWLDLAADVLKTLLKRRRISPREL